MVDPTSQTVSAADFPPGTDNRVAMRYGCYFLFALATVALLVRFYVRTVVARKLGFDDLLIMLSWLAETVHVVCVKMQFERGVGWHVADLSALPNAPIILTRMILWPWITQALYYFGLGCIKASIVSLYLRLAVTPIQRKVLWGMLVFVLAQGFSSTIAVAAFLCTPLHLVWTAPTSVGTNKCINILHFNYYNAAFFIVSDILLAVAPFFVIRNLQMDAKKKRSLAIMFSLGALAIGGTIARQVTNAMAISRISDFTWYWAPTALCSILESSLGIIFVCVPAMAPLFKNWVGGSTAGKYTETYDFNSNRPGTFGKLSNRPRLRPDDESILCTTQITVVDKSDRDSGIDGHELDSIRHSSEHGSDRGIVVQSDEFGGQGQVGKGSMRRESAKNGVRVKTEYQVDTSSRR